MCSLVRPLRLDSRDRFGSSELKTGLDVIKIGAYLGSFDYTSGSGKLSRQFNFVLGVASGEPVVLQEHDEYIWTSLSADLPVTDAVKHVFAAYPEISSQPTTP